MRINLFSYFLIVWLLNAHLPQEAQGTEGPSSPTLDVARNDYDDSDFNEDTKRSSSKKHRRNAKRQKSRRPSSDEDSSEAFDQGRESESNNNDSQGEYNTMRRGRRSMDYEIDRHEIRLGLGDIGLQMQDQGNSILYFDFQLDYLYLLAPQFQFGPLIAYGTAGDVSTLTLGGQGAYNIDRNPNSGINLFGSYSMDMNDLASDKTYIVGGLGWKMNLGRNVSYHPKLVASMISNSATSWTIVKFRFLDFSIFF